MYVFFPRSLETYKAKKGGPQAFRKKSRKAYFNASSSSSSSFLWAFIERRKAGPLKIRPCCWQHFCTLLLQSLAFQIVRTTTLRRNRNRLPIFREGFCLKKSRIMSDGCYPLQTWQAKNRKIAKKNYEKLLVSPIQCFFEMFSSIPCSNSFWILRHIFILQQTSLSEEKN